MLHASRIFYSVYQLAAISPILMFPERQHDGHYNCAYLPSPSHIASLSLYCISAFIIHAHNGLRVVDLQLPCKFLLRSLSTATATYMATHYTYTYTTYIHTQRAPCALCMLQIVKATVASELCLFPEV